MIDWLESPLMLTASQLVGMTDNEMATYASGSYGPAKRTEMIALIRRLALAETQKANAKEQILDRVRPFFPNSSVHPPRLA